jgi:hypothetical protein
MEKELIWIFGHIPGFSANLPSVIAKLHSAKEKYLSPPASGSPSSQIEVGVLIFMSHSRPMFSVPTISLIISNYIICTG